MKEANLQAVLARLAEAADVASSGALSGILGVTSQAVYDAKKKNKIPDSWIRIVAERTGVSADWLFFGRGPMRFDDAQQAQEQHTRTLATPLDQAGLCSRCAKLEEKLDKIEEERRELSAENRNLSTENRKLWQENGNLRERCARFEERQACGNVGQ